MKQDSTSSSKTASFPPKFSSSTITGHRRLPHNRWESTCKKGGNGGELSVPHAASGMPGPGLQSGGFNPTLVQRDKPASWQGINKEADDMPEVTGNHSYRSNFWLEKKYCNNNIGIPQKLWRLELKHRFTLVSKKKKR